MDIFPKEDEGLVQEYWNKRWNLNASFRLDRSESHLSPESFDLINSRLLSDGIDRDRWPTYVRDLRQLLRPGCWLQMVELHLHFQSDSGRLSDDSFLNRWWMWHAHCQERMRKDPRIAPRLSQLLTNEGFEYVRARDTRLPIGAWDPGTTSAIRVIGDQSSRR